MHKHIHLIPHDEVRVATQWRFPVMQASPMPQERATPDYPERPRSEVIRQEAYAQGYAQGQAQAQQEAQQKMQEYIEGAGRGTARQMASLILSLTSRLEEYEQDMASGILELACELARQVVRKELSVGADALQPVIKEALGILLAEAQTATLHLNPVDLSDLKPWLEQEFAGNALTWVADSSLERENCWLESGARVVNGSLEKRWQRAIDKLGLKSSWAGNDSNSH